MSKGLYRLLYLANIMSLLCISTLVSAENLIAPSISAPSFSTSGSYDLIFDAPVELLGAQEIRLYENVNTEANWQLVKSISSSVGDQAPFTHSISNKFNGVYQYRSEVCL